MEAGHLAASERWNRVTRAPLSFVKARQAQLQARRAGKAAGRSTDPRESPARRTVSLSRMTLSRTVIDPSWGPVRAAACLLTESFIYKVLMGSSVMFNMALLILETDLRSSQRTVFWEANGSTEGFKFNPEKWMVPTSNGLVLYYVVDLALRIFVFRMDFFYQSANIFDCIIVLVDALVFALEPLQDLPSVAVLRMTRMLRIVRVLRNFLAFRELYLMMQGLVSAIRSIIFATLLIAIVLLLWSIMAVELVHLRNVELYDDQVYGECNDCRDAFSSVLRSSLTFMKGIVAGDSWGLMSLPLIINYPQTAFVLLGSLLMVQLGLLNLIVAVIVDRAAVARENDEELKFCEKQEGLESSYARLKALFSRIDADGGGSLSLQELQNSYDEQPEFREILDLMDIRHQDLELVFDILDRDGDNEVSYQEFVEQLHEVKTLNSHTALIYIKHFAESVNHTVKEIQFQSDTNAEILACLYRQLYGRDFEVETPCASSIRRSSCVHDRQSSCASERGDDFFFRSDPPSAFPRGTMCAKSRSASSLWSGSSPRGNGALSPANEGVNCGRSSQLQQHLPQSQSPLQQPPGSDSLAVQVVASPTLRHVADAARNCTGGFQVEHPAGLSEVVKEVATAQIALEKFFKVATTPISCADCGAKAGRVDGADQVATTPINSAECGVKAGRVDGADQVNGCSSCKSLGAGDVSGEPTWPSHAVAADLDNNCQR